VGTRGETWRAALGADADGRTDRRTGQRSRQRARKELDTSPTYGQRSAGPEQGAPWSAGRQGRGREQTLHLREHGARSSLPPPRRAALPSPTPAVLGDLFASPGRPRCPAGVCVGVRGAWGDPTSDGGREAAADTDGAGGRQHFDVPRFVLWARGVSGHRSPHAGGHRRSPRGQPDPLTS